MPEDKNDGKTVPF